MKSRIVLAMTLLTAVARVAVGQDKPWELVGEVVSIEDGDDKPVRLANVTVTSASFYAVAGPTTKGCSSSRCPRPPDPARRSRSATIKTSTRFFPLTGGLSGSRPRATLHPSSRYACSPKARSGGGPTRSSTPTWSTSGRRPRSVPTKPGGAGGGFDPEASLGELASYAGFTSDEARGQLAGYVEAARKERRRQPPAGQRRVPGSQLPAGRRALPEGRRRSGEAAGTEQLRLGAYEREAAGDAFYNEPDFARALTTYQDVEKRLVAYRATREALGMGEYPESVADRRRLAFKAANAKAELAVHVEGQAITRHLNEAIDTYRNLLDESIHVQQTLRAGP